MKFIHIADVHLGAKPDKGHAWSEKRRDEIWQTFRRIIDRANYAEVDLLLISGDLFHTQPLNRDLKEVNYLFSKLKTAQVVLIMGNHDYLKEDSPCYRFNWAENVTCFFGKERESLHFVRLKTTVYGLSYHEREIREALYDDIYPDNREGCHILLAHGGDEYHIPINKYKLSNAGFDYVALGHIHKPQILVKNKMAYAGALEPIDVNDIGKHGYILGEYEDGNMNVTFVPFAQREYIHLIQKSKTNMTDTSMEEELHKVITQLGQDNIYKICLVGFRDSDITYDLERYRQLGNIIEITDQTEPDYNFRQLYQYHKNDILGRYIERLYDEENPMGEVKKRALYYGIHALLQED